jgi:hypothetical protein
MNLPFSSLPPDHTLHRLLRRLPGGDKLSARIAGNGADDVPRSVRALLPPPMPLPLPLTLPAPALILQSLLMRSQEISREQAETAFFQQLLAQMVPDQARILAALSDGSPYPTLELWAGGKFGFSMSPVLTGISSVGRNAGVLCPDLTSAYLRGLINMGLVEMDAGKDADLLKYELLETDSLLRQAVDNCRAAGRRCRIVRHTVRITPLGQRLWTACHTDE